MGSGVVRSFDAGEKRRRPCVDISAQVRGPLQAVGINPELSFTTVRLVYSSSVASAF